MVHVHHHHFVAKPIPHHLPQLWPPHRCPCAHPFTQTASQAVEILEAHFGEEEDEDENLAPNVSGGGFSFGNMAAQQQQQPAFAF